MDCQSQYYTACIIGNLEKVARAIRLGAVIEKSRYYGMRLATDNNHLNVIKYHTEQYPQCLTGVHFYQSVIYNAAAKGHIDIIRYFKSILKNPYYFYTVVEAIQAGNLEMVKLLTENINDKDKKLLIVEASYFKQDEIGQYLKSL